MRINGFSGMDIDSMVKSLMTAQRAPLDKLNQQKQILEWTRDSYREINSKIIDFNTNKLKEFNKSGSMNTQLSTVTGNTTAVKAEATANANGSSMSVEVTQLAKKSYLQTGQGLTKAGSTKPDATLNTTLEQLTDTPEETYELNINGKKVTFLKTDTISAVIGRINSSDAKVTASFDEISGKFSITARDFGAANNINITGETVPPAANSFLNLIKVNPSTDVKTATNAEVKISSSDGSSRTYNPEGNSLTVNGVVLTLMETTTAGNPSVISTQSDPKKAIDSIKAFVESYNDLISTLATKTGEQKYRDFPPLTSDQKANMKENEITAWEAKAKSGLLKNDDILSSTISSMREVITKKLGQLSSIGITTGQYYENGKLNIDEEKLKAALTSDPDKVVSIFQGAKGTADSGIFSDLSEKMGGTLDKLVKKAGTSKFSSDVNSSYKEESVMGKQLKYYNKQIADLQNRLEDIENRYYKQFTAMEQAMTKYQSQSSSLFGTSN